MELDIVFSNIQQKESYYCTARNQLFSGGYNNGKTFIDCFKCITLLLTFPGYRVAIGRQVGADLKKTTMETFFQILPKACLVGHNSQDGITNLRGGSKVYWVHLDKMDETTAKGLEVNSIFIDQAEETEEKTIEVLDARLGRWSGASVPTELLEFYRQENGREWPVNRFGKHIVPSYFMLACNPEDEFHHLYRYYHPESEERREGYSYIEGQWDKSLGSIETYNQAIQKDEEWVAKKVLGKWGVSGSAIHKVTTNSILSYNLELLKDIQKRGWLFRTLDHGLSAPTCCCWWAIYKGVLICYREYYVADKVISYHRRAIAELSGVEEYQANYADPAIFIKASEKDGGFTTVAAEYYDANYQAPSLVWQKADNNEFATRNKINELLIPSSDFAHPITNVRPSPGMYFIKASVDYPYGCKNTISQTGAQKKKLLGTVNGKNIYSDDRDDKVVDHAYDNVRYAVSKKGGDIISRVVISMKPKKNTFAYFEWVRRQKKLFESVPQAASLGN